MHRGFRAGPLPQNLPLSPALSRPGATTPRPCVAPMDPYTVKSLLWQLLNGLSFMHQNWIIHRDLKVGA